MVEGTETEGAAWGPLFMCFFFVLFLSSVAFRSGGSSWREHHLIDLYHAQGNLLGRVEQCSLRAGCRGVGSGAS